MQRHTEQSSRHRQSPCDRQFLFVERGLSVLSLPGARIALTLFVAVGFYVAAFCGVKAAVYPGHACLAVALSLSLNPNRREGFIEMLVRLWRHPDT